MDNFLENFVAVIKQYVAHNKQNAVFTFSGPPCICQYNYYTLPANNNQKQ